MKCQRRNQCLNNLLKKINLKPSTDLISAAQRQSHQLGRGGHQLAPANQIELFSVEHNRSSPVTAEAEKSSAVLWWWW